MCRDHPERAACRVRTPLVTHYDKATGRLTADLAVPAVAPAPARVTGAAAPSSRLLTSGAAPSASRCCSPPRPAPRAAAATTRPPA
ncbi:hypothetical protein O1L60_40360 [Streptomyces diastatochromogenes]|nr:hypothetical protein [Streptomyces diastatochromogenes]